jgi:hypothetical protein
MLEGLFHDDGYGKARKLYSAKCLRNGRTFQILFPRRMLEYACKLEEFGPN